MLIKIISNIMDCPMTRIIDTDTVNHTEMDYDAKVTIIHNGGKISFDLCKIEGIYWKSVKDSQWCEIEMEPGVDLVNILGALESMIWDNNPPDKIED